MIQNLQQNKKDFKALVKNLFRRSGAVGLASVFALPSLAQDVAADLKVFCDLQEEKALCLPGLTMHTTA